MRRIGSRFLLALTLGLTGILCGQAAAQGVVVGSKRFTESYILGELACQTLQRAGVACEHKQGLGNTGVLEQALASGGVMLYPEYTGTIVREILKREAPAEGNPTLAQLNQWLAPKGLMAAVPLGFNNTYALAMREEQAAKLNVLTLSDLARLAPPTLKTGLSHEFLVRADGWPALQKAYGLPFVAGAGLDHGLAYEALQGGQVDVIDVYSTDAKIGRLGLRVLADDRAFFPRYDAVLLMKATLEPRALAALRTLEQRIDERAMIAMNAAVELDKLSFSEAARRFLDTPSSIGQSASGAAAVSTEPMAPTNFMQRLLAPDLARLTLQHLVLVFASLALALLVGVPLAIVAWRFERLAGVVLAIVSIVQTVPSLALLAFLIAMLGTIGFWPALLALFVYALLPVVSNTLAGLRGVPQELQLAARALALSEGQVLRLVMLPLALPVLLAGARTAAVINVGTATVAAFVGAGGYGERIVAGLAVNDSQTLLAGALPAALMAWLVQLLFAWLERRAAPMAGRA